MSVLPTSSISAQSVALIIGLLVVWYGASGLHNGWTRASLVPFVSQPEVQPAFLLAATAFQLLISGFSAVTTLKVRSVPLANEVKPASVWLLGTLHYITTLVTNAAYAGASVAMAQSIKAAEPLFVLLLSWLLFPRRRRPSAVLLELVAVTVLCTGVVLLVKPSKSADVADDKFWTAVWLGIASNVANALRALLFKSLGAEHPLGSMTLSHLMNFCSFAVALPATIIGIILWPSVPQMFFDNSVDHVRFISLSLMAGFALFAYNHASFWVLAAVTPTTHSVIKALKRPVIVAACILLAPFIGSQLDVGGGSVALGIFLLFIGACLQGFVSIVQSSERYHIDNYLPSMNSIMIGAISLFFIAFYAMSASSPDSTSPALVGSSSVDYAALASRVRGAPPLEFSCFSLLTNRGDQGVYHVCRSLVEQVGNDLGLRLRHVDMAHVKESTLVVFGGGSLLNALWAMDLWDKEILQNANKPRDFKYPFLLFGGGYDDNTVSWTDDRAQVNAALEFARKSGGAETIDTIGFPPLNLLPLPDKHVDAWRGLLPNMKHGGVRGPISARAFGQEARTYQIDFPVHGHVLGDAGDLIAKHVDPSLVVLNDLGLEDTRYVVVIDGYGSDGSLMSELTFFDAVREKSNALKELSLHAIRQGYHVVIMPMADGPRENAHVVYLHGNVTASLSEEEKTMAHFVPVQSVVNIAGLFSQASAVVSHKLHGAIFAGSYGTPAIALAYRIKHYDWAVGGNVEDLLIHLADLTPKSLIDKFEYVMENRESVVKRLSAMAADHEKRYEQAVAQYLVDCAVIAKS